MGKEYWNYFVALRQDILSAISGISDANGYLRWDNTTPNSTTRYRLECILTRAIRDAANLGVYVVTRHSDCGRRSHDGASDENGYVWTDPYGLNVKWLDGRFLWDGDQLFQWQRYGICPCSKTHDPQNHHVIDDIIYSHTCDPKDGHTIAVILSDIHSAIEEAGDKKPRSGIREYLLRAVLRLNDAILPVTVEEYINSPLAESRFPAPK